MGNTLKRRVLWGLLGVSISLVLITGTVIWAQDSPKFTSAGKITSLKDRVITLNNSSIFYPDYDAALPKWVKVGARVKISYYRKNLRSYYYALSPEYRGTEAER
jgi:hypothetical protein